MSFQPVLPLSGLAGWHFLSRTREQQQASFASTPQMVRDVAYFAERIGSVRTAKELVGDRRLLSVALGAFGLEADLGSKAFVQKVLEGGSLDSSSLANRLADKRYLRMAEAFGFGDPGLPNTQLSDFAAQIVAAYQDRQFEAAVGAQRPELRLALGFSRDLTEILGAQKTENGRWYAVMGNTPLREVMQKALGLPKAFAALDIDRQLEDFKQAARQNFGTDDLARLAEPELAETVIRRFLLRSEVESQAGTSKGQMALLLLQSARARG